MSTRVCVIRQEPMNEGDHKQHRLIQTTAKPGCWFGEEMNHGARDLAVAVASSHQIDAQRGEG